MLEHIIELFALCCLSYGTLFVLFNVSTLSVKQIRFKR